MTKHDKNLARKANLVAATKYLQANDSQLAASLRDISDANPDVVEAIAEASRKADEMQVEHERLHRMVTRVQDKINAGLIARCDEDSITRSRKHIDGVLSRMGREHLTFRNKSTAFLPSGDVPIVPVQLATESHGMLPRAYSPDPWLTGTVNDDIVERIDTERLRIVTRAVEREEMRATMRNNESQFGTIDGGIDEEALAGKQGISGTAMTGTVSNDGGFSKVGVPNIEQNQKLAPYLARGLSTDPGEFESMYRTNSAVQAGVMEQVNLISGATWEFRPPEINNEMLKRLKMSDDPRDQEVARSLDLDRCWRVCDALNLEFATNPALSPRASRESHLRSFLCQGFGIIEFSLLHDAPLGRRIGFLQDRLPSSIDEWIMKGDSTLAGFIQSDPNGGQRPVVDIRKCIYSARQISGTNWEGISALRSSYSWDLMLSEFVASAILHRQRFGAGIPVIRRGAATTGSASASNDAYRALSQYANLADAVLELGPDVMVEIMQMAAETGLSEVVELCVRMQREAVGAQLSGLGTEGVGSYAAGDIKSRFMLANYTATAEAVAEGYRSLANAYTKLFAPDLQLLPVLRVEGVLTRSPSERITVQATFGDLLDRGVYSVDELRRIAEDADVIWDGPTDTDATTAKEVAEDVEENRGDDAMPLAEDEESAAISGRAATIRAGHTHDASCGCERNFIARATQTRVRVVGRDGKAFTTFRALNPARGETSVAWSTLHEMEDSAAEDISLAVASIQRAHRNQFATAFRVLIDAGDIAGLSNASIDYTAQYRDAVRPVVERLMEDASKDMLAEIADQIERATGKRGWSIAPQVGDGRAQRSLVSAVVDQLARKLNDQANERLAQAALAAASGAPISTLTRYTFGSLGHQTAGLVHQVANTAVNAARAETAEQLGPRATRAIYSPILDRYTCPECEKLDGVEVQVGSERYKQIAPPNKRCASFRNSRASANECRCVFVYLFDVSDPRDEVPIDVESGSDLSVNFTGGMVNFFRSAGIPAAPITVRSAPNNAQESAKPLHAGMDKEKRTEELSRAYEAADKLEKPGAVVIWGAPGAGKSTLGKSIAEVFEMTLVDGDDFRVRDDGTIDRSTEAGDRFDQAMREAVIEGNGCVVVGVMVSEAVRERVDAMLRDAGARDVVFFRAGEWMTAEDHVVADRLRAHLSNREPIPYSAVKAMYDESNK